MVDLPYQVNKPDVSLGDYVDSFWLLYNDSNEEKAVIILPDGRIDLFLSRSSTEPFHLTLMGIGSQPDQAVITPNSIIYAISFKLPAVEYIFGNGPGCLSGRLRPGISCYQGKTYAYSNF